MVSSQARSHRGGPGAAAQLRSTRPRPPRTGSPCAVSTASPHRPVVLLAEKLAPSAVALLGDEVEIRHVDGTDRPALLEAVADADALLVRSATKVDAEVLAAAGKLKDVAPADASLRRGEWKRSAFSGVELNGKTVGVVGLGKIGQLFAQRIAAFGTALIAYDPYVAPARAAQLGIELVSLDELLERSDAISIHLPKTAETLGLIGAEELKKAKKGIIIVNAARGGLVDEDALVDAVRSGHI